MKLQTSRLRRILDNRKMNHVFLSWAEKPKQKIVSKEKRVTYFLIRSLTIAITKEKNNYNRLKTRISFWYFALCSQTVNSYLIWWVNLTFVELLLVSSFESFFSPLSTRAQRVQKFKWQPGVTIFDTFYAHAQKLQKKVWWLSLRKSIEEK